VAHIQRLQLGQKHEELILASQFQQISRQVQPLDERERSLLQIQLLGCELDRREAQLGQEVEGQLGKFLEGTEISGCLEPIALISGRILFLFRQILLLNQLHIVGRGLCEFGEATDIKPLV